MKDDERLALEAKLLAALARREYSRAELWRKYSREFDPELLDITLTHFAQKDWQNDQRFAESFVRNAVSKGQGRIKLRHALEQHEISTQTINELLDDVDWFAVISSVYERKYNQPVQDLKDKAKRQRFLVQRGFTFDEINEVIQHEPNNS